MKKEQNSTKPIIKYYTKIKGAIDKSENIKATMLSEKRAHSKGHMLNDSFI